MVNDNDMIADEHPFIAPTPKFHEESPIFQKNDLPDDNLNRVNELDTPKNSQLDLTPKNSQPDPTRKNVENSDKLPQINIDIASCTSLRHKTMKRLIKRFSHEKQIIILMFNSALKARR